MAVTRRKYDDDGVELSRDDVRTDCLARLALATESARWAFAADKVHHAGSLLADLRRTFDPEAAWSRLPGGRAGVLQWYREAPAQRRLLGADGRRARGARRRPRRALAPCPARRRRRPRGVVVEDLEEFRHDVIALERDLQLAVHVDRCLRFLEGARQRDADVRVLRLARAVHDAAHHRDLHLLDAGVRLAPHGHLVAQVVLDVFGHLLEERRRRAPAAGTRGHLRRERAQLQRLQDLLRDEHLFRAIAAGPRRERDADRVADALGE